MEKTKWWVLFFICFIFFGCVSDDTPSGVIRIFYNAVLKDDLETFSKYAIFDIMRADSWLRYARATLYGKGKIINISEAIDGDNAVVKATFEHGSYDFYLLNVSGKWKVLFSSPF